MPSCRGLRKLIDGPGRRDLNPRLRPWQGRDFPRYNLASFARSPTPPQPRRRRRAMRVQVRVHEPDRRSLLEARRFRVHSFASVHPARARDMAPAPVAANK